MSLGGMSVLDRNYYSITTRTDPETGHRSIAWKTPADVDNEVKNWADCCSKLSVSDVIAIASFLGDGIGISMLINDNTVPGAIVLSLSFVTGVVACVKSYVDINRNSENSV